MKRLIIVLVAVSIGFCVGYAVHQQPSPNLSTTDVEILLQSGALTLEK